MGDLLDSADEKATDTDLQSLTRRVESLLAEVAPGADFARQVGDTFGAKKAVEAQQKKTPGRM